MELSHTDKDGKALMVDISAKQVVKRTATARGKIYLQPQTIELVKKNQIKKGDVLACARIAGISGGKRTSDLIPLCHTILIDQITVDFEIAGDGIEITSSAICSGKTGIEMEAITAVSLAAVTIYDMCKAVDKQMVIGDILLLEKKKEPID